MPNTLKAPQASQAKAAYHLNQLRKLLSRASAKQFLQMIWAVNALHSGRPKAAGAWLSFPPQATDQSPGSPFVIHRWELETLLTQLLLTPRQEPAQQAVTVFDCGKFASIATLVNRLRELENVESAVYLRAGDFSVFGELRRIAQRQFHWQRGYFNMPQFYRYAFIYGQGKCSEYFQRSYGLSIAELNLVGFALFVQSMSIPWMPRTFTVPEVELIPDLVERALPWLLISVDQAREETRTITDAMNAKHGRPLPSAFLPSILRRYPLVCLKDGSDELIAPIPELILMRVTSGLYYDLIPGGQALLNEANDRFEEYCARYIEALMIQFKVSRAYRYEPKKGMPTDTPDLMIRCDGKIVLAAECKATKLTFLAQFAEDPLETDRKQYLQIANGVFQLWRFFSHVRRGLLAEVIDVDAAAMVITLDSFLTIDGELKSEIIREAISLADKEGGIAAEDRRHVVFSPISDLEAVLARSTERRFLDALKATREKRYVNWELREVHRDTATEGKLTEPKSFPFSLDGLLPWWKRMNEFDQSKAERSRS